MDTVDESFSMCLWGVPGKMPQTNLLPMSCAFGHLRLDPVGTPGFAGKMNYLHRQYRRLRGSGQRGRETSFDRNSKLNKHLQLVARSAMAGYGIWFFGQCGGVNWWWTDH